MFNKVFAVITAVVGASSLLAGVAALPANLTESAIAGRSINPSGTHTGQGLLPSPMSFMTTGQAMLLTFLYQDGGKTIRVGIVDRCEGCALWDLDLSPSAFQQLAPLATGRLYGATWHFN
ncbi:hypothetical protein RhiTH_005542 [Rhizoctonia solani]